MKINEIIRARGMTKSEIAVMAKIPQNDFYQCTNGKKSFFPSWRKRVANVLQMPEDEVFPEYIKKEID